MLQVNEITKSYGSGHTAVTALDHASFSLEKGRLLAILGPSGSGKTTLISIIAGLLTPTSGEIVIGGHPVHLRTAAQAARFRRETVGGSCSRSTIWCRISPRATTCSWCRTSPGA